MSGIELLPCPFCGRAASYSTYQDESLWSHAIVTWYEARCADCDVSMNQCDDADELERRWNMRDGLHHTRLSKGGDA